MPAHRKLVKGVGVNDAPFPTTVKIDSYNTWLNMLGRCYAPARQDCYAGCTVDPRWHSYMAFKEWYDTNHRDGWHMDKDLLVPGNRVYGPDACVFVPAYINDGIIRTDARGWTISKSHPKTPYQVIVCGKNVGRFATEDEARRAWVVTRISAIIEMIDRYMHEPSWDARVVEALRLVAGELKAPMPLRSSPVRSDA